MTDTVHYASRHAADPKCTSGMGTEELRARFLMQDLFQTGRINLVYTQYDRMVAGGAVPAAESLVLSTIKPTGTKSFLDRREMIAVNIGGPGIVSADGETYPADHRDMVYLGMGTQTVSFASAQAGNPAKFYLLSAPAHHAYPCKRIRMSEARRLDLGSQATSNERSIFQYIHADGVKTCQLVAGMTQLAPGSVWNTMPCHVHDRRMEVYLYFGLPEDSRVFHFMGEPGETRHIVVRNEEAVLSPGWSIHSGAGTANYAFIWAMAGDNIDYTDIDPVSMDTLR